MPTKDRFPGGEEPLQLFAKRLKQLRLARGKTVRQVAAEADLSPNSLIKWEEGTYQPKVLVCAKLASYYGVSLDYLAGLVEDPTEETASRIMVDLEAVQAILAAETESDIAEAFVRYPSMFISHVELPRKRRSQDYRRAQEEVLRLSEHARSVAPDLFDHLQRLQKAWRDRIEQALPTHEGGDHDGNPPKKRYGANPRS